MQLTILGLAFFLGYTHVLTIGCFGSIMLSISTDISEKKSKI